MDKYDTFGSRFLASFLDGLIMIPVGCLSTIVPIMSTSGKITIVGSLIFSLIPTVYTISMHYFKGQTIGKSAVNLKVLDISERPITFAQAVIRSLPQMLPIFISASLLISSMFSPANNSASDNIFSNIITAFYGLYVVFIIGEIISALFSSKHRALHDYLAGTVVTKTDGSQLSVTP